MIDPELKSSSDKVGCLYPILLDANGIIIDGEHRFRANKNWRKIKLHNIKTERERLVVRIVANNIRRRVSSEEKIRLLGELGQALLREGVKPGRIAYIIAEETGMSYRWVAKYLPDDYKNKLQLERAKSTRSSANEKFNEVATENNGKIVIKDYANTGFVNVVVERDFYQKIQNISAELGIPVETSIINALEQYMTKMKKAVRLKNSFVTSENVYAERVLAKDRLTCINLVETASKPTP
jgi:hypothetical protein